MRWGLYDTEDDCWLGDAAGPRTFSTDDVVNGRRLGDEALTVARAAAEIVARRAGWPPTRVVAKYFPATTWHEKDEVALTGDALTILRNIERGRLV